MGKIMKSIATVFALLGILFSIILGALIESFLYIVIGSLISCISWLSLYGIGQLLENSEEQLALLRKLFSSKNETADFKRTTIAHMPIQKITARTDDEAINKATTHFWVCENCGNKISESVCPFCGTSYEK